MEQSHGEARTFRLDKYLDGVLASLGPQYKQKNHSITVNCQDSILIHSFPGTFSQIVTNLVMNSLLHGFDGICGGEILLDISLEGETLHFDYADNGEGMQQESVKCVFDPFYTTKRNKGGTGLGMHIVYNLVTRTLGGRIECESEPGNGARFNIVVPLQKDADQSDAPLEREEPAA